MIVPVWFETWELGCCIGVLRPGSRIEVFPLAYELVAVSHPDEVTPRWWVRDDGTVEFTAVAPQAVDPSDRLPPVVPDVGSLTIARRRIPRPGPMRARARLHSGSHDAVEPDQQDLVGVTGTVTRVRKAPGIWIKESSIVRRCVGFRPPRVCDRTSGDYGSHAYVVDLDCS